MRGEACRHINERDSSMRHEDLLFAALREVLGTNCGHPTPPLEPPDVEETLSLAAREQLDAIVARGLALMGTPEELLALGQRCGQALRRALLLERNREEIARSLSARGVQHLFLKAALCDSLWWEGQGLRGGTDIDVLIPRTAETAASDVLRAMGYRRKLVQSHLATAESMKERMFIHGDTQRFAVDLHVGLLNEPPFRDSAVEVLARGRTYETAAGSIAGPSLEDMLVHAGGNLGQEGFAARLKLALDAACLIHKESLDCVAVARRADACGVRIPLWGLLRLVQERLWIPVPESLMRSLGVPRWLQPLITRRAGVHARPAQPASALAGLLLVDWPLSGRLFWPFAATCRWARLRAADFGIAARSGMPGVPIA
jgi:hypothetical protein